ncbi:hypothetical protein Gotur_015920, partial [Gossypium turneri]
VWSSITVDRELLAGSGFLAFSHYRPGVQVVPETHQRVDREVETRDTFHLLCEECTITLEDVQLELGLPVDGSALTGSVQSIDWGVVCYALLGTILDNIYGGRIEMD